MPDNASSLPARGQTWFEGTTPPTSFSESVDQEGQTKTFDDTDPGSTAGLPLSRRTGRPVVMKLVRNVSGITLGKKRLVTWKTGHRGKRVDGYCEADLEEVAGVVDDHYPTGIPANDLGWIVIQGPCLVLTSLAGDAENVIAEHDPLVALTAANSTAATTGGRFIAWKLTCTVTETTDGTNAKRLLNYFGRAMSAKTTANTNADCLVDMELLSKQ